MSIRYRGTEAHKVKTWMRRGTITWNCVTAKQKLQRDPCKTICESEQRLKLLRDQKKVLVMCSTIDMLTPHEVRFSDLERQTILYGPFNEPVLGHLLDALLGKLLAHHSFLHMLVRFLRSVADHCLGISKYAFRRLLVDAIEHAGVWLLKEQHDDLDLIRERQANLSKQNSPGKREP